MSNIICLIVGTSGVGKSTAVNYLHDKHGLKVLQSYTTRPKRTPDEDGHIFVTEKEFDKLKNICAYTKINGYRYCATSEQIDNADLYIIDEDGIEYFTKEYKGNKKIIVVRLFANDETYVRRMYGRGDDIADIQDRILHDKVREQKFSKVTDNPKIYKKYEFNVGERTPEDVAEHIYEFVFM